MGFKYDDDDDDEKKHSCNPEYLREKLRSRLKKCYLLTFLDSRLSTLREEEKRMQIMARPLHKNFSGRYGCKTPNEENLSKKRNASYVGSMET